MQESFYESTPTAVEVTTDQRRFLMEALDCYASANNDHRNDEVAAALHEHLMDALRWIDLRPEEAYCVTDRKVHPMKGNPQTV